MNESIPRGVAAANGSTKDEIDNSGVDIGGSTIKIKVSHGSNQFELTVPSQFTFGDLKAVIAQETGLEPKDQILLFRGKDIEDDEFLHMVGLKDNSKLLLVENSTGKEVRIEEVKGGNGLSRGSAAVAEVRADVDELAEQVDALNTVICNGSKVAEMDLAFVVEMLTRKLLKLDSIEAEGEGKAQRKMEVRRVQNLLDTVDSLKEKNSCPNSIGRDAVSVTPEPNVETLSAQHSVPSSTKVTQDWEVFE